MIKVRCADGKMRRLHDMKKGSYVRWYGRPAYGRLFINGTKPWRGYEFVVGTPTIADLL